MSFSLREFFVLITAISLAVPALYFANPVSKTIVLLVTALIVVAMVIRAGVERGAKRAGCFGFAAASLVYVFLWTSAASTKNGEWKIFGGPLPTETVASVPLKLIQDRRIHYVDLEGVRVSQAEYDAARTAATPGSTLVVFKRLSPEHKDFMPIAHCLWTLLFGYLGMKYAVWVYARRGESPGP